MYCLTFKNVLHLLIYIGNGNKNVIVREVLLFFFFFLVKKSFCSLARLKPGQRELPEGHKFNSCQTAPIFFNKISRTSRLK